MKLKLLVLALAKLLEGTGESSKDHPADMYLPEKLLSMAIVFFLLGLAMLVLAVLRSGIGWAFGSAALLVLGVSAALCWRNQKIVVLDEASFSYTTMLGKTTVYRFDDIVALRRNRDSFTLILKDGKVHIESMAVVSDRLIEKIGSVFGNAE